VRIGQKHACNLSRFRDDTANRKPIAAKRYGFRERLLVPGSGAVVRVVVSARVSSAAVMPMMMALCRTRRLNSQNEECRNRDKQQRLKNVFHGKSPEMQTTELCY
jgi:hypothetical protein